MTLKNFQNIPDTYFSYRHSALNGCPGVEAGTVTGAEQPWLLLLQKSYCFCRLRIHLKKMKSPDDTLNSVISAYFFGVFCNVADSCMAAACDNGQPVLTTINQCGIIQDEVRFPDPVQKLLPDRLFSLKVIPSWDLAEENKVLRQFDRF